MGTPGTEPSDTAKEHNDAADSAMVPTASAALQWSYQTKTKLHSFRFRILHIALLIMHAVIQWISLVIYQRCDISWRSIFEFSCFSPIAQIPVPPGRVLWLFKNWCAPSRWAITYCTTPLSSSWHHTFRLPRTHTPISVTMLIVSVPETLLPPFWNCWFLNPLEATQSHYRLVLQRPFAGPRHYYKLNPF